MRRLAPSLIALVVGTAACSRCGPQPDVERKSVASFTEPEAGGAGDPSAGTATHSQGETFILHRWSFRAEEVTFAIEDVRMTDSLDAALERSGALLAFNGGFFSGEGAPLGLAVSNGRVLSRFSKAMSGGVLRIDSEGGSLAETESFAADAATPRFAVQCRPRLVVAGQPNVRSDDGHRAERTAICLADHGSRIDVFLAHGRPDDADAGPSLYALAHHLAGAGCEDALNLDGGPSSGAAWRSGASVSSLRPRGPIRHAIVVLARGRAHALP